MALTDKLTAIADAIRSKTGKTAALTLDQMPTEIAGIQTGGDGSPRVVENVVNIGVAVSVTAEKYPEYSLYNGVRLPNILTAWLTQYPYAWIRKNNSTGYYDLFLSALQPWHSSDPGIRYGTGTGEVAYYKVSFSEVETGTGWVLNSVANTWYGLDDNRTVLWSNHDIPNGSADATVIYFTGSEPVPTD